jgi:cold shock CspA family protein
MTSAATSGAFRQPSDHIDQTKTPSDLQQRDRESLYSTDRGTNPPGIKAEKTRFSSFAASRFRRRHLPPPTPCFQHLPPVQPSRFEAPSGPPVHGVVKWFSPDKGFGFVELSDGSSDAFLHGSVLAQSGINTVEPGETLEVRVGPGHKGPHITEVISVDRSTAEPTTPRRSNFGATTSNGLASDIAVEETGTVKWFNAERGYGFIALDSGGKDVFAHLRS